MFVEITNKKVLPLEHLELELEFSVLRNKYIFFGIMFKDITNVSMLERYRVFIPKGWTNISQSKLAAIRFTKEAF